MHKKFEVNRKIIKGGSQSGKKVATHNSKSGLHTYLKKKLESVFSLKKKVFVKLYQNKYKVC